MLASFSGSVTHSGGRTVEVQPLRHMVRLLVACVTLGLSAPGVQGGSGREYSPEPTAWQEPGRGWGCTIQLLAVEYARPLAACEPAVMVSSRRPVAQLEASHRAPHRHRRAQCSGVLTPPGAPAHLRKYCQDAADGEA